MLTRNTTALLFGTKACSRRPPRPEMTLIAKGVFTLRPGEPLTALTGVDRGALTAETFAEGDDERRGECHYPGDFADFKLNAEVLLRGTCFTPRGKPLAECGVRFAVGAWSKLLRVTGPRLWTDNFVGAATSAPIPFAFMPLTWANAFGGPGHPHNPVGMGLDAPRLPTVEYPAQGLRARADRPPPAGFGPLNPAWPPRAGKVGKAYGRKYLEERAPYYAEDFDYAYFSAAPPDQQWKGYLRGDEEVSFQNLHPAAPLFSARLPGLRVRAFVIDQTGRFREVAMVLDTLFADVDAGQLSLVWRGVDAVREADLADVRSVMVVTEPLADTPRPAAGYEAELLAFEHDPIGLAAARQEALALHEKAAGPGDPTTALIRSALAGASRPEQIAVVAGVAAAGASPGAAASLAGTTAHLAAADSEQPPVPVTAKPGVAPSLGLRRTVRDLMNRTAETRAGLRGKPLTPEARVKLARMEQLPHDPRWAQMDPGYTPPQPLSTDEPGPHANLIDRDLTGRDLRGVDLSHANLDGAVLTRANLAGVRLVGANLRGAVLYQTDLSGADLGGADLSRANLAKVRAEGANFTGAVLEQSFFEDAFLRGAILMGARGEYTVFARADLTRARAREVTLFRADFGEATLNEADFLRASLIGCVFETCVAHAVDLTGTALTVANFARADLAGARFLEARGERAWFTGANLDGADLRWAALTGCHFTEASARQARFGCANLKESRFYRTCLDDADFSRANLLGADLGRAQLSRTRFNGASLYEAKFVGASGASCDFTDANLKRSTLEHA
jgi:uncharacterized protein YjbI with pentapeptide repeats